MAIVVTPQPGLPVDRPGPSAGFDRNTRLLIVDRQPLFAEALRTLLAAPPMLAAAQVATNSEGAVALAAGGLVDLVLCDACAEPLAGPDLVRALARLSPPVPAVLLGDLHELLPALDLLLEAPVALLTKDVAPGELLVAAIAVLSGHRAVGARVLESALAARSDSGRGPAAAGGGLSPAEREVLSLLAQAHSVSAIAQARGVSQKTVRNHMASIYRKLELRNRTEAVLYAARLGLAAP